ncbi:hypothetical protein [Catenulispora sp. EB89]|uniref:hypothetical protein n=1 Tax=Catenulispora sp. EB89 TaxID=3156257 RepID=UPI0035120A59
MGVQAPLFLTRTGLESVVAVNVPSGFATIFWVSVVSAVTSVAVPVSCAVVEASAAAGGAAESFVGFEGFFGGVVEP